MIVHLAFQAHSRCLWRWCLPRCTRWSAATPPLTLPSTWSAILSLTSQSSSSTFLQNSFSPTWPAEGNRWSPAPPRTSGRCRPLLPGVAEALLLPRGRSSALHSTAQQAGLNRSGGWCEMKSSKIRPLISPATDFAEKLWPGAPPVPLTKPSVVFSTCTHISTLEVNYTSQPTSLLLIVAVFAVSFAAICFAIANLSIGTGTWSFFPFTPIVAGVLYLENVSAIMDIQCCPKYQSQRISFHFIPRHSHSF